MESVIKNALYNKRREQATAERVIGIFNEEYYAGYFDAAIEALLG